MYFGRRADYLGGVYGRLCREPMAEMECLGLFPLPFQPLRTNLPALFLPLVSSLYALMLFYVFCEKENLELTEKQPARRLFFLANGFQIWYIVSNAICC